MDEKKRAKRSLMKPFVKNLNFTHIMPTRYTVRKDTHSVFVELG